MDQELRDEIGYLKDAINELLRRVPGPAATPAATVPAPVRILTPEDLPDPVPGEGIASYAIRCGQAVGGEKGAQAVRAAGSLFLVGQTLVNKHGGVWKAAIWEFIHGDPNFRPDPAWGSYRPGR